MQAISGILLGTQIVLTITLVLFLFYNIKSNQVNQRSINLDTGDEYEDLKKLRKISLAEPLSEKTRPVKLEDVVGQESGIKALKAALCGPNPRHVIIYGPPGVGKTAAARVVLEYAKKSPLAAFLPDAPFVELDGAVLQFDERGVADPLIGSVHDPIYQGAGAYGSAGVPNPRPGAVTKAHGGVLFIDEIGELNSIQMNKLLKVLEDRKVFLTSSYYSPGNMSLPGYVHDVFKNGFPADFRLVGATTRKPSELPEALRSRCAEVYFRGLSMEEIRKITVNALEKTGLSYDPETLETVAKYSSSGRDAVSIVQTAASLAASENRGNISVSDAKWITESGRYSPRPVKRLLPGGRIGIVNGMGVSDIYGGAVIEIEAAADLASQKGSGKLTVTGAVDRESVSTVSGSFRKRGSARSSVDNALTVLKSFGVETGDYDLHINFPLVLADGPSAGIAVFAVLYSAVTGLSIPGKLVMTGELTIKGKVEAVGGVREKLEAAKYAGADTAVIPRTNDLSGLEHSGIKIIQVDTAEQALTAVFGVKTGFRMGSNTVKKLRE